MARQSTNGIDFLKSISHFLEKTLIFDENML